LSDVAAAAGVSAKTASRALNGHAVNPETAQRVIAAAGQLRFRPNGLARDLRRGGVSSSFGLVVGELANPFYSELAAGAERSLRAVGLELTMGSSEEDAAHEQQVVRTMLERRVQALFVVTAAQDHGYLQLEHQLGTPIVFLDRPARGVAADSILLDNRAAAARAVEQLVASGHRNIAALADATTVWTAGERVAGVRSAYDSAGLGARLARVISGVGDIQAARAATARLLSGAAPPTALVCLNNRITLGALTAMRDLGMPTAIIGFDDFDSAELLGISVVNQNPGRMGELAVELALERLNSSAALPQRHVVLDGTLIPRGSGELSASEIMDRRTHRAVHPWTGWGS
jgi:LacI family transcriptional regulator